MKFYKICKKTKITFASFKKNVGNLKKVNIELFEPKEGRLLKDMNITQKLQNILNNYKNENYYGNVNGVNTISETNSIKVFLDFEQQEKNQLIEEKLSLANNYDIRVLIGKEENSDEIVNKIFTSIDRDQEYISTRGGNYNNKDRDYYTFLDVIRDGLAKDRGLFVPKYFPRLGESQWKRLVNMSYQERCFTVLENFPLGELKPNKLWKMINEAYSTFTDKAVLPIRHLETKENGAKHYLMEEFYGPSASFKDLALQLFPRLFSESVKNHKQKMAVLVATSGDTGSAVLSGFKEIGIPVIVLYPYGKVSEIQAAQMTTAEGNVCVLGVKGDFDFCQTAVKDIFNDTSFTEQLLSQYNLSLTSANSINWGRLLPQVCYSIHAYMDLVKNKQINFNDQIDICIPSGNFGHILGAFIAKRMGLPINKLICASNENKILTDFINTGEFNLKNRKLRETISPAIDILLPSNIERLLYFLTNDPSQVKSYFDQLQKEKYFKIDNITKYKILSDFRADFCTEEESLKTISDVFQKTGFIIDPHTAVAKTIADRYSKKSSTPLLIVSTAHYAKFPETLIKALKDELKISLNGSLKKNLDYVKGIKSNSPFHQNLENILDQKVIHKTILNADMDEIKAEILNKLKNMSH